MAFADELQTLLDEGRLQLAGTDVPTGDDLRAAERVIAEFETRYRLELPGEPPSLSMPAAVWAADSFYRAGICLTYREIDAAGVEEMLAPPCPAPADASAHYSVDIVFRLLPDLCQRARAASGDDPLLAQLQRWANAWPLSSVGISEVEPDNFDEIVRNECILLMCVDRIIAAKDTARLTDARIRNAVAAAIGMHGDLAPEISKAMSGGMDEGES